MKTRKLLLVSLTLLLLVTTIKLCWATEEPSIKKEVVKECGLPGYTHITCDPGTQKCKPTNCSPS